MCDGSCIGRGRGWPHTEGANRAAGLPGPLFQQSGVYHYTDIHMELWECYECYAAGVIAEGQYEPYYVIKSGLLDLARMFISVGLDNKIIEMVSLR